MSLTQEPDVDDEPSKRDAEPKTEKTKTSVTPWVVCAVVCVLTIAMASAIVVKLWNESKAGPGPVAPVVGASTTSSSSSQQTDVYRAGNARACGALQQYGRAFYQDTYLPLMQQTSGGRSSMSVEPIKLAAQLGVLYSQLDTTVLSGASPAVSQALGRAAEDADVLAQSFANIGVYGGKAPEMTSIVNSYTDALIACTMAGFQPSYFDPQQAVGR